MISDGNRHCPSVPCSVFIRLCSVTPIDSQLHLGMENPVKSMGLSMGFNVVIQFE